jgi:hypothetical protein
MSNVTPVIGALIATYFVSRATLRIPYPLDRGVGLVTAHVLSFLAIGALVFALREPSDVFATAQLVVYAVPQLVWLALDYARRRWPAARQA